MSNKKKSKKNENNFPSKSLIKMAKSTFNQMINEMPDEEFVNFITLFFHITDLMQNGIDLDDMLFDDEFDDFEDYDDLDLYDDEDLEECDCEDLPF